MQIVKLMVPFEAFFFPPRSGAGLFSGMNCSLKKECCGGCGKDGTGWTNTAERVVWWDWLVLVHASEVFSESPNSVWPGGWVETIISVFISLSQLTPTKSSVKLAYNWAMTGFMKTVWAKKLILKIYINAGTIMQSFLSLLMILTADTLSWLCTSLTLQHSSITCF